MIQLAARGVLLDIEGTTSSVAFVHDVMFPYARQHVRKFLLQNASDPAVLDACRSILRESSGVSTEQPNGAESLHRMIDTIQHAVGQLMDEDRKSTGLKALQGMVWKQGFQDHVLKAHVYPDVRPAVQAWRAAGLDVRIYSSGSIAAQKLFFGHTEFGDMLNLFTDHYDTTIGSKKELESYRRIVERFLLPAHEIVFLSDIEAELDAASQAGMQVIASCRPGNAALSTNCPFPQITSFSDLQISRT